MLYVPFSLLGSLFCLRGDLEREHFLKRTRTNCSNDGPGEKMEMQKYDDKYNVWLCFSHFSTTVCGMLRTASFWKNGDFSIVTVFKTKTYDSEQKKPSRFFSLGGSTRFDYLNWHCQHKCPSGIFSGVSMYCISVRYVPFQNFILSCTVEWFLNLYSLKQLLNWKQCLCQRTMLCVMEGRYSWSWMQEN